MPKAGSSRPLSVSIAQYQEDGKHVIPQTLKGVLTYVIRRCSPSIRDERAASKAIPFKTVYRHSTCRAYCSRRDSFELAALQQETSYTAKRMAKGVELCDFNVWLVQGPGGGVGISRCTASHKMAERTTFCRPRCPGIVDSTQHHRCCSTFVPSSPMS